MVTASRQMVYLHLLAFVFSGALLGCGNANSEKASPPEQTEASTGVEHLPSDDGSNETEIVSSNSDQDAIESTVAEPLGDEAPRETLAGNPIDDRARELLGRMIRTYQAAQTYEDNMQFKIVNRVNDGPLAVRFQRPNKVDAQFVDARIVSDGTKRTVFLPKQRRHVITDAPEKLNPRNLHGGPSTDSPLGTVSVPLQLLVNEGGWDYVLEDVIAVSVDDQPVNIEGRWHDVVRLERTSSNAVLFLDRETSLIRRLELDLTELIHAQGQPVTGQIIYTLDIKDASIDTTAQPFSFTPPSDSQEVENLGQLFPAPEATQPTQQEQSPEK